MGIAGGGIGVLALAAALILAPVSPELERLQATDAGPVATVVEVPEGARTTPRRRTEKKRRRGGKITAEGPDREDQLDKRRQRREEERALRDPMLEPDERAEARRLYREERLVSVNEKLDAFADERGWDPETTEDVRLIMLDTADRITVALAKVDTDRNEWEEIKADVRQYRLDQASDVEALVGPEEFEAFIANMQFDRFTSDPPVRGRLDDRPQ